ncbi:MAG: hypothetical protein DWQ01_22650 [Planctomycetota bacterium]|nr:MAG: hypothetical protein DWQ01_22650 [Planctomycetota bacterium]
MKPKVLVWAGLSKLHWPAAEARREDFFLPVFRRVLTFFLWPALRRVFFRAMRISCSLVGGIRACQFLCHGERNSF